MAAITATTVAAGISAVSAATGAVMSFSQAGQAKAKAAEASQAADKAIAEAKKNLDVNFYDALSIQKEPYELQREALLAQGAEAVRAGQESERGAAATAGRIQMAQNEAQAGIRTQMGQDLMGLEKLSAAEDSRLRDVEAQINMEEAAGAQLARANFEELAGRATTQGMQGIVNVGQAAASFVPLYMKDADAAAKMAADAAAAKGQNLNGTLTSAQIQKNAQSAFAPQLKSMGLPSTPMQNPTAQLNQNYLAGIRPAQGQYDAYQAANLAAMRGAQGKYEALQRIPTLSINPFDVTGLRNAQQNIVAPF
jgi:hypothetical protein